MPVMTSSVSTGSNDSNEPTWPGRPTNPSSWATAHEATTIPITATIAAAPPRIELPPVGFPSVIGRKFGTTVVGRTTRRKVTAGHPRPCDPQILPRLPPWRGLTGYGPPRRCCRKLAASAVGRLVGPGCLDHPTVDRDGGCC